jgi:gas vesicle protein
MENQKTECSAPVIALAFLGGAIAGALAGILLAPKSGEETRRALKGYSKRIEEGAVETAKEARAAVDETIARGKCYVAEKTAHVEAAVKAGREAMQERVEECCN